MTDRHEPLTDEELAEWAALYHGACERVIRRSLVDHPDRDVG